MVELLGGEGRIGRCDDHIAIPNLFDKGLFRFHEVTEGLDAGEVFPEGVFVGHALLVGVQPDRFGRIESVHIFCIGQESYLPDIPQQFGIEAIFERLGHLLDYPLSHAVGEQVCTAFDQDRRME